MNVIQTNLIFDINKLSYGNNPKEIILHHADAYNCSVEDVHNWHKNQNWAGIGYHYFIKKSGEIYKGREDNMIGSHCLGHNKDTIGICFEGKYTEETMPEAQIEAGRELINYLKKSMEFLKLVDTKIITQQIVQAQIFHLMKLLILMW